MKKKLHRISWLGVLVTMLMALIAFIGMSYLRISDTRSNLRIMAHAASEWIVDSNSTLEALVNKIASLAPRLRVTLMLNHGLVLADSEFSVSSLDNHFDRPEVIQAIQSGMGESLRLSDTMSFFTLNIALRVSPSLILRLSYPLYQTLQLLIIYALGLTVLFLLLYVLQRRALRKFAGTIVMQMEDVRTLLEGNARHITARFPEFQPALDHISYLAARLHDDLNEVSRTLNLRTDFVAHASHELRSPLTSIMGFAEMLDEGMADSPEETALCLSAIRNECQRMLTVIEDILHLSHAESDSAPEKELVDVRRLTQEILRALQPQSTQKDISLHLEGDMQLFAAEKDLWEILYNLISNAIKYGNEHGHVHIHLQENTLSVSDDGIGIAREHLPRLFEQFYRVDDARGMAQGGTGLGLSIVKALCTRYQADISVESEPGHGSCFTLCFPSQRKEDDAC